MRSVLRVLSGLFLVVHASAMPQTLEDIDSVNFAMGVESFDVARHQPHPPGYPVYIALAKASTAAVGFVVPSWDRDRRAAVGLAIWSVLAGTLAVYVIAEFWIALGLTPLLGTLASLVAVTAPLFWFTAVRPLTDTPAVLAALVVQTWMVRGWREARAAGETLPRDWILAAVAAGFFVGLRSQTLLLTAPLLLWAIVWLIGRRRTVDAAWLVGAVAAGALVWAVPLVWDSGGVRGYLAALGGQGGEDFASADILVTRANWRMFQAVMRRTFSEPWLLPALANVVLVLAIVGIVRMRRYDKHARLALALAFVPYLLFHVIFQETITIRYSLPLVVPVAGLAVIGVAALGTPAAVAGGVAIALTSLIVVQPRLEAFAANPSAVVHAFRDMQRALPASAGQSPVLRMHHQLWHVARRPLDWYRPQWDVGPQPFPGDREWLGIVQHWTAGETRPVWLLADTSRNDVKLFDWRSTERRNRYEQPISVRPLIGGLRLDAADWWSLTRPRWMLGTGWSLTPEIAGMTGKDGTGPHLGGGAEAFLLRDNAPVRMLLGARYLARGGPPASVTASLDGNRLGTWPISQSAPWFVQWIDLPAGTPAIRPGLIGPHPYARLTVAVESAETGRPAPIVGLEQFDLAPATEPVTAFLDDWNEYEGDPRTGRLWRWTTAASTLQVKGATRDLQLTLEGESPLRYFDRAPTVVVRAGQRELARFSPAADFSQKITVPLAALTESDGRITIATDLTFVPKERGQGADPRKLGLRLYRIDVR